MQTRFQNISLILWLLVYMPFAQATFGQAVLCMGADGHVALENTGSDGACHGESHLSDVDCLTEDHCGTCLDLLPDLDVLKLSRQDVSLFLAHFPLVVATHTFSFPSDLLEFPPLSFQKHIHASVSTTVLQI